MGITNLLFFLPGVGIVTTFGMWISGSIASKSLQQLFACLPPLPNCPMRRSFALATYSHVEQTKNAENERQQCEIDLPSSLLNSH